jgi:hypothetical protein
VKKQNIRNPLSLNITFSIIQMLIYDIPGYGSANEIHDQQKDKRVICHDPDIVGIIQQYQQEP